MVSGLMLSAERSFHCSRSAHTPFSFPSNVTAFRGCRNGMSPSARMPHNTVTQIRLGSLVLIIYRTDLRFDCRNPL